MKNTIEALKQSRQALIDELTKAGAKFKGNTCNCPYHRDKKPSAGIFQDNSGGWRFKCQSCNATGDVWDVKARNEGKHISEIIKGLRNDSEAKYSNAKIFKTTSDLKAACPGNVEAVYQYTNPATHSPDMIVIRCQTESGKTFRQCRPCDGGFEMKAPVKPWPIYNRGRIAEADTVVVVEGEKCVHALNDYSIIATTSPAGAGKAEYSDWQILAGKNIILWPDNDEPGRKHAQQIETILQRLQPKPRISIIEPADFELVKKEDAADFIEICKAAKLDVRAELDRVLQSAKTKGITASVSERIENIISGKLEAVSLPWPSLSYLSNAIIPGTVTLLCGSPGASKSFMLLQALNYWTNTGIKACIYELEEDKEFHLMRALAQISGLADITKLEWVKDNPDIARNTLKENQPLLEKLAGCIWTSPETQQTLDQLAQWADEQAKAGFRVICIDPVTAAVQTTKPWIADNAFLQQIKRTATDSGCSFVLVTHPAKTINQPDLTALSGSAAYSRFAQTIFWLHNHEPKETNVKMACGTDAIEHNRTVHILKARNGKGQGLNLACQFNSQTLTLQENGLIVKN